MSQGGAMENVARKLEPARPWMEYGRVEACAGRLAKVRMGLGLITAERAVGCLLDPHVGDEVLLSVDGAGSAFILSILRRPEGTEAIVSFDGPASFRVAQGNLTLAAQGEIGLAAGRVAVDAEKAVVRLGLVSLVAERLESQVKRIKSVSKSVDAVCRRLTQRLGNSFRYVEEHDETQAQTQRVLVEDLLTMHSKNAMIVSEEHVTVNAEQIHLG